MPDGRASDLEAACAAYEKAIRDAGGVDLQILGIGANGHIGFNEPTSSFASRTRLKTLAPRTREDNARFFDRPDEVPTHCVTQGLGTIMEARELLLVAHGSAKAAAIAAAVEGPVSAVCPGSILQFHPHATVIVDEEAAGRTRPRRLLPVHLRPQAELATVLESAQAAPWQRTVANRRQRAVTAVQRIRGHRLRADSTSARTRANIASSTVTPALRNPSTAAPTTPSDTVDQLGVAADRNEGAAQGPPARPATRGPGRCRRPRSDRPPLGDSDGGDQIGQGLRRAHQDRARGRIVVDGEGERGEFGQLDRRPRIAQRDEIPHDARPTGRGAQLGLDADGPQDQWGERGRRLLPVERGDHRPSDLLPDPEATARIAEQPTAAAHHLVELAVDDPRGHAPGSGDHRISVELGESPIRTPRAGRVAG